MAAGNRKLAFFLAIGAVAGIVVARMISGAWETIELTYAVFVPIAAAIILVAIVLLSRLNAED